MIKKTIFLIIFTLFVPLAFSIGQSLTECSSEWHLKPGSRGEKVRVLQEILRLDKRIYPEGRVTGYYGSLTKRAVQRLQRRFGLPQVGWVGSKTAALVFPCNYEVDIVYPERDMKLFAGRTYTISLRVENVPKFLSQLRVPTIDLPDIYLLSGKLINIRYGLEREIFTIPLKSTSINWRIDNSLFSGTYKIKVSVNSKLVDIRDETGSFEIAGITSPTTTTTTPPEIENIIREVIQLLENAGDFAQQIINVLKGILNAFPQDNQSGQY